VERGRRWRGGAEDEKSRTGRVEEIFCVPSAREKKESKQSKTSTVGVGCTVGVNGCRQGAT
jgi:hypothetical protein